MSNRFLQNISIHLSKAICLRDAFSGEAVTAGVQIRTLQGKKPVMKPGGYWLFLDMGQEIFDVEIISPIYQKRILSLQEDGGEEVLEVFLYPSRAYPVKPGGTAILGRAEQRATLRFYLEDKELGIRLFGDYEKGGREISLFMGERQRKGSCLWFIQDKVSGAGEYFRTQEQEKSAEIYQLLEPLKEGYRKKDTVIYPAYECTADEEGEFYLLIGGLRGQEYQLCLACGDIDDNRAKAFFIQGTKWNTITGI